MKSKVKALQCPCGCEYEAAPRLELLYTRLTAFNFEPVGCVDCKSGSNEQLYVQLESLTHVNGSPLNLVIDGIAASVNWNFTCVLVHDTKQMRFDVSPVPTLISIHKD